MAWKSASKSISLFSAPQPSKSSVPSDPPHGKLVRSDVFYRVQDLDSSTVAYVNGLLNPCSDPNFDISKNLSVLRVDAATVAAQKWLLGVFSKALEYHLLHNNLLFVDHINCTLVSWYGMLIHRYKQYPPQSSITRRSWNWMIRVYLAELLDLLSTWLIYAIEEGYSHGHLLECIYFLDMRRPRLMICDGFDKNSKIDRNKNPRFYQADLDALQHVLFVITNEKPVEHLLAINGYAYSAFKADVPDYITAFDDTLSKFPPVPCIHRILLKPSFIRPFDARIKYFYALLHYFQDKPHEKTAFDNLGWSWLVKVQSDMGYVGQFFWMTPKSSVKKAVYQGNSDVLRFFRNADQHMIQDLNLGPQGFDREDLLLEFDKLLGFTKLIDEKVHTHATTYPFSTLREKEAFLMVAGF